MLSHQYKSVFTDESLGNIPQKDNPLPKMPDIRITQNGVYKLLEILNINKAAGPDYTPTRILKDHRDIIAPILATIFQKSLNSGVIPKDWINANIVAVFKKGNKHLPSNYRPVSLTSVSCKILEHIIYSRF